MNAAIITADGRQANRLLDRPLTQLMDVGIGLLLYASTLYFLSNAVLLLVLILLAARAHPIRIAVGTTLPFLFVVLACANLIVHLDDLTLARHSSSFAVFLTLFMAVLAPSLSRRALLVFVALVVSEIAVGGLEFASGRVALTSQQAALAGQTLAPGSDLLYSRRVFGLSSNSSLFAQKIFISIIVVSALEMPWRVRGLLLAILSIGLVLSFNRTAIGASMVLVVLLAGSQRSLVRVGALALLAICGALLAASFSDEIARQFLRGSTDGLSHSELSRFYFWSEAVSKIAEHPLFGNGSLTFRIPDPVTGLPQHAHNSLLMLFATHGVPIGAILILYLLSRLSAYNLKFVAAIFAMSLTQFFVFWNLSVPDLILYWLLGQVGPVRDEHLEPNEVDGE